MSIATGESLFINRGLSWLDFNDRVLAEARDERNRPLERLRFLSIVSSNLPARGVNKGAMGNSEHGVIERERKYKLGEAAAGRLRARLEEVGRFVREERQDTIVLKDRASHLKKGAYLRFRTVDGRAELTHKGPKQAQGKDKWRLEHTVALAEGPALELLEKMGFRANTHYIKDTAIFLYRGVLVSVDRIVGIGWFCEIETDDLEKDLDAVATALDLDDDAFETRGYPTIAAEAAREKIAARA